MKLQQNNKSLNLSLVLCKNFSYNKDGKGPNLPGKISASLFKAMNTKSL